MQALLLATLLCGFITIGSITGPGKTVEDKKIITGKIVNTVTNRGHADTLNKKNSCPICHKADQVIPIKYGRPGNELMKLAEAGKVKLGGCVLSEKSPRSYCKRDKLDF